MAEEAAPSADQPAGGFSDIWKASISAKGFGWFVMKAIAGITAAPYAMSWLQTLGLELRPDSVLAAMAPKVLPAILGGLLHVGQDWASLKSGAKWL